ncbi:MAG: DUF4394 domain-containing protein [Sphingomonadaceae bacterium]
MHFFRLTLAAALVATPAAASAETLFGLTRDNRIVAFNAMNPVDILWSRSVTGLMAGDMLLSIDKRPATGSLYALGSSGTLYELSMKGATYQAMPIMLSVAPMGNAFGFDFNPVPDRLRLVSDTGQNLRINVDTGMTIADGMIMSDTGPVMLVAAAYTNNFAGATSTTLYAIDAVSGRLLRSTNPNGGLYTGTNLMGMPFQPLGFSFTTDNSVGFDISGRTGMAFANIDSLLWKVNLETGEAMTLGIVGAGPLRSIATGGVIPEPATWAMLIAGFGLVGGAMRRRRLALETTHA